MALVGPRPTVQVQVDQYTDRQRRRLEVRPGITGWAQVNGRASLPWSERIELDIHYLETASPLLDAKILLATARRALSSDDLYRGETGGWR
jgi:lipopolysaccharide/colanic/teichoic acid biosynthesis glycosyltransferase